MHRRGRDADDPGQAGRARACGTGATPRSAARPGPGSGAGTTTADWSGPRARRRLRRDSGATTCARTGGRCSSTRPQRRPSIPTRSDDTAGAGLPGVSGALRCKAASWVRVMPRQLHTRPGGSPTQRMSTTSQGTTARRARRITAQLALERTFEGRQMSSTRSLPSEDRAAPGSSLGYHQYRGRLPWQASSKRRTRRWQLSEPSISLTASSPVPASSTTGLSLEWRRRQPSARFGVGVARRGPSRGR